MQFLARTISYIICYAVQPSHLAGINIVLSPLFEFESFYG